MFFVIQGNINGIANLLLPVLGKGHDLQAEKCEQ